jgi:hypothetical protein
MTKEEYLKTREQRAMMMVNLATWTDAPRTVAAWIRHVDKLEVEAVTRHGKGVSLWPTSTPDYNKFFEACLWDFELWAAEQILSTFE